MLRPMPSWGRWLILLLLSWSLAVSAAQTAAEKEAATRFQRGVGLFKDGDFEAALTEFKQAYRLAPFYEVLYNIGLTQRRLYQYGAAVKALNDYLEQGGKKISAQRRELVRRELEEIRQLTAMVTVVVKGEGPATLTVDGEAAGQTPLKEPLLLRPGKHTFVASRGEQSASETTELLTGSQVTITLEPKAKADQQGRLIVNSEPANAIISIDGTLQGEAPVVATLPAGAHTVAANQDGYGPGELEVVLLPGQSRTVTVKLLPGGEGAAASPGGRRRVPVAGIVVGTAGLGLIGGAIAFNLQAQASARQMTALFASGGAYDPAARNLESTGHTASALSWVLGITGGLTFGTGLILVLADLFSGEPEESAFFIAPVNQGFAAAWRFSW